MKKQARTLGAPTALRWILLALMVSALFATAALQASSRGAGYRVVVHDSNPVSSLSKKEVSKLFLKKTRKWDNGKQVVPIDLPPTSLAREEFSQEILSRTIKAVRSYWRLMAFTEGQSQPPELASEREVLEYVATDPVAIGYVSADANIAGYAVKTIRITE